MNYVQLEVTKKWLYPEVKKAALYIETKLRAFFFFFLNDIERTSLLFNFELDVR